MTEIVIVILGCVLVAMLLHGFWWRRLLKDWNWSLHETVRILTNKVQRLERGEKEDK